MNIFITGGAGYIGSHTCVELLNAGHQVAVFDNFCDSDPEALARVERISGVRPRLYQGDVRDLDVLTHALRDSAATAVIHFAGLKAVGDSVLHPLNYYDNNVLGTLCLLRAMGHCDVKQLVFSSSATVYGDPIELPIPEKHALSANNPYGQTKLVIEKMLRDLYSSDTSWRISILRYFNPVGAHSSGLIGEDPKGTPNNLMPFVAQVAVGRREYLNVWGNDYATPDGTGVRDYIHVVDLALGHVKALERLQSRTECEAFNLGTGIGYSVLDIVRAFEAACGKELPYRIAPRRSGDIAVYYADPSKAKKWLNWEAQRDLKTMCEDSWRWQSTNPLGYG
ncbi:MAG: UDP-glucose 4-epimerase GalE [Burkholderiales bacterium PBB3]|nr:MAG: UDP-glucose 4-epimerase GalE [Burkholderiales bacterium PBB3]